MADTKKYETEKAAFALGIVVGGAIAGQLVRVVHERNKQLTEYCLIQQDLIETWEEIGVELHSSKPPRKELMAKIKERYEFAKLAMQAI